MYVLLWIGGEILLAILAVRFVLYAICVLLRVEEVPPTRSWRVPSTDRSSESSWAL